MYYVIKDSGILSGKNLKSLNRRFRTKFEESEFVIVGPDHVVKVSSQDFDFVQDKFRMENLCFAGFFKKDNSVKLVCIFNLILTFINLIIVGSCNGNIKDLVTVLTGGR